MHSSTSSFRRFTVAFLASLLICGTGLAGATEWIIRTQVIPAHNFTRYLALFRSLPNSDVAFGDSIIANGFAGAPGFANMAMGGDNFAGMARKVRLYYTTRRPGRVVLQAGLHHLSNHYMLLRNDDEGFSQSVTAGRASAVKLLDPLYRYEVLTYWQRILAGKKLVPRERIAADGSRAHLGDYSRTPGYLRHSAAAQQAVMWEPAPHMESSSVMADMAMLLAELKAKGGQPCLVTYPITGDLRAVTDQQPLFRAARAAFSHLAAEAGVPYVDLFDMALPDNEFADVTHLNESGARQLTPQIIARCFGDG